MGKTIQSRNGDENAFALERTIYNELGMEPTTPIAALTLGQFLRMQGLIHKSTAQKEADTENKEYIYGLRGIQLLFGVSHKTAQAWKNTFLAPACVQMGKTIIVDRNKAIELFEATGRAKYDCYGL